MEEIVLMERIDIEPIGYVRSNCEDPHNMCFYGEKMVIEVMPEYVEGLLKIEEHSHYWILSWFHKAPRNLLKAVPRRINPDLPERGVFSLRTFLRPNPIALTLVKLLKAEGNKLYVEGLDAIDGTPVLDIKPYFEKDIIFSPTIPYFKASDIQKTRLSFLHEAINHHQEDCDDLYLAVRMAAIAEEELGKLSNPNILVKVVGSPCLADAIQGITRARLANPARFTFEHSDSYNITIWSMDGKSILIEQIRPFDKDEFEKIKDEELFKVKY